MAPDASCMEVNPSSDTCMPEDNGALFSSWLYAVMMLPKSVSQFDKGICVQEADWLSAPRWDDVHRPAVMLMSQSFNGPIFFVSLSLSMKYKMRPRQNITKLSVVFSFWQPLILYIKIYSMEPQ